MLCAMELRLRLRRFRLERGSNSVRKNRAICWIDKVSRSPANDFQVLNYLLSLALHSTMTKIVSNDQGLIQSNSTSVPQNPKGKYITMPLGPLSPEGFSSTVKATSLSDVASTELEKTFGAELSDVTFTMLEKTFRAVYTKLTAFYERHKHLTIRTTLFRTGGNSYHSHNM